MTLFSLPWNDSWGEDAADAAAVGPPRVGVAVIGDVGRAGGGGALPFPLGLRQSMGYIEIVIITNIGNRIGGFTWVEIHRKH